MRILQMNQGVGIESKTLSNVINAKTTELLQILKYGETMWNIKS